MAAAPQHPSNSPLELICTKANQLAVLPHVVHKILEMTGKDEASAGTIEAAIIVDPGFSTRVLAQANSAKYALSRKVTSIRDAIMFLGFKALRELAMTVGVFDLFVGKSDRESLRRRAWWRQSLDTAHCAAWLAKETNKSGRDEAYTCGLLHLVGKNLLDRFGEVDYANVDIFMETYGDEREAERRVFGCDHVEVALAVSQQWGFPEILVHGLNYIDPPSQEHPHEGLRACVAVASLIARRAVDPESEMLEWPEWALSELSIPRDQLSSYVQGGISAIASATKLQI